MQLPLIEVEYDGNNVKIDVADFNSLEWRALRVVTGLTEAGVINDLQELSSYAIAGLIWMVLRRDAPALAFEEVAQNVGLTHALQKPDDDAEVVGPRRRRQLLKYLPGLSAVFGIRPWEVDDLTSNEVAEFLDALSTLKAEDGDA